MRFVVLLSIAFLITDPVKSSNNSEIDQGSFITNKRQEVEIDEGVNPDDSFQPSVNHGQCLALRCKRKQEESKGASHSSPQRKSRLNREEEEEASSQSDAQQDHLNVLRQRLESALAEALDEHPSEKGELQEYGSCLFNDVFIQKLALSLGDNCSLQSTILWEQSLQKKLSLMKRSEAPPIPIFVLGSPRSGTTLIGNYIGSCKKVCNLIEYPGFYLAAKVGPSFQKKVAADYKPELYNAMFDFMQLFSADLVRRQSCEAYVDSNPFNFRIIKKLQEKVNPALFIVMLRDYRGVISSLKKSCDEGRSWAGPEDADRATLYYKFYKRLKNINLNQVIFLNYDQLCGSPKEILDTFEEQFYNKLKTLFNVQSPKAEWRFDRRILCENQAPTYLNAPTGTPSSLPRTFRGQENNDGTFTLNPIASYNPKEWSSERDAIVREEVSKIVTDLTKKIPHKVELLKKNPAFAAFYKTLEELKNKYKGKEVVSINSYRSFGGIEQGLNARPWQVLLEAPMHNKFPDRINFLEATPDGSTKSYLTLLWEALHQGTTVTLSNGALVGMGGVGKTSLALAYAYEALEHKAYDFIYWLPSATLQHLLEGYKNILKKLNVDLKGNETEEDLVDLVNQELPNKTKKWLLVYDNVPNPEFLQEKVPQVRGHILITSRYQDEWPNKIFYLDVFNPNDAVAYLLKALALKDITENQEQVRQLAEELGNFPLALSHAASFIQVKSKRRHYSIETYLQDFKKQPETLLSQPLRFNKKSQVSYENLVAKTLRMAGEYISTLARELLIYFAYLDPDHLVGDFFLRRAQDESQLEDALDELVSFSIIKKSPESISIHRLVQLVIRTEQEKGEALKALPMHLNNLMSNLVSYWQDNLHQSIREKRALLEEEELSVLEALHNKASTLQAHLIKLYQHFQQATVANKLEEDLLINLKMGNLLLQRVLNEDFSILKIVILKKMQEDKNSFQNLPARTLQDELKNWRIEALEENLNYFFALIPKDSTPSDISTLWNILTEVDPSRLQGIVKIAQPLLRKNTEAYSRARIIQFLADVDPSNLQYFIEEAQFLLTKKMSGFEQAQVIKALTSVAPSQLQALIKEAQSLLTEDMGGVHQCKVIEALTGINPTYFQEVVRGARLFMSVDIEGALLPWIITSLGKLDASQLGFFIKVAQFLQAEGMEGIYKEQYREVLTGMNAVSFQSIRDELYFLLTEDMKTWKEQIWIIKGLASVNPFLLQKGIKNILPLITKNMDGWERMTLIEAFAGVDPACFQKVLEEVQTLLIGNLDISNKIKVIKIFLAIDSCQLQKIVKSVQLLLTKDMSGFEQGLVIQGIAHQALDPRRLQEVAEYMQRLFTKGITGFDKARIIIALTGLDTLQSQSILQGAAVLTREDMKGWDQAQIIIALILTGLHLPQLQSFVESMQVLQAENICWWNEGTGFIETLASVGPLLPALIEDAKLLIARNMRDKTIGIIKFLAASNFPEGIRHKICKKIYSLSKSNQLQEDINPKWLIKLFNISRIYHEYPQEFIKILQKAYSDNAS
jgi:GTPase SAR1 family protein